MNDQESAALWAQASAAWARGAVVETGELCDAVLKSDPANLRARHLLALTHFVAGRPEKAADLLAEVARAAPADANVQAHFGSALGAARRHAEALVAFDRALALGLQDPNLVANRALALSALGRHAEALAGFEAALARDPTSLHSRLGQADALAALGQAREAEAGYRQILASRPDHGDALNNLAVLLANTGRPDEAISLYAKALALTPGSAALHNNLGVAHAALKQPIEAIEAYDQAIALDPSYAEAHSNRGKALAELLETDEALAAYDHAVALKPDYADAIANRGLLKLQLGRFAEGWADYERRWESGDGPERRHLDSSRWTGAQPIEGRTLLLHAEQGFGDTIQFVRYAERVARRGVRVVLEVPGPLAELVRGMRPAVQVVVRGAPTPGFDLHCPMMSLPLALGEPEPPAWTGPYLFADPERVAAFEARLGPPEQPRIGLVWSGNPQHNNDRNRSLPIDLVEALCPTWAQVVGLQLEFREGDREKIEAVCGANWFWSDRHDFADTAALIECCDLVISVDTAVAHLAGAMGKATWILLPYSPDWRWGLGSETSAWYPQVRLWRQTARGDWTGAIKRVNDALSARRLTLVRGSSPS